MYRKIFSLRSVFVMFAAFAVLAVLAALPTQTLHAEKMYFTDQRSYGIEHRYFSNRSLRGAYVAQSTGTINFPMPPLSDLNGPSAITGRLVADGYGNISGEGVQVNNGMLMVMPFTGTYEVEKDGTFSTTVTGETPFGPLSIEYYGVLFDGGKQAKVTVVGVNIPGISYPPGFVGITGTGSFIRQ